MFAVYEASVHCWIKPLLSTQIGIKKKTTTYVCISSNTATSGCVYFFRFIIELIWRKINSLGGLLRGNFTVLEHNFFLFFFSPVETNHSPHIHISGLADEGLRLHASPSAAKGVGAAGPSHPVWSRRLLPAFTRLERGRCARQASLKSRGEMAAP